MATATGYATSFLAIYCPNQRKSPILSYSSTAISSSKSPKSNLSTSVPRWHVGFISQWNGLRHLGISVKQMYGEKERKGNCRGMVVYASLFGVGAPEALVIGVVALLVFGPKGLAEVARNLGKTLRAFQPTIKELQEVSREFKTTLEREIGLDDPQPSTMNTSKSSPSNVNENPQAKIDPNGTSPTNASYSSEDFLRVTKEQVITPVTGVQVQQAEEPAPEEQPQDGTSPTKAAYSSEELLKVTEEQLTAAAAAKEQAAPEEQAQVGSTPEIGAAVPLAEKPERER
ncbi:hypothetical protein MRB53_032359 [Persea americana]|uniref:Uncharacterized protein n=1 Tax=Persea americana TaxID=3435 RepID=A0ACC2KRL7_PERAE|nr:hypothetical protein MRB53_032359 [Persea americana]|eukprot:TRINITY_DN1660_c0_g5_i1.p1 TRINITY_DN1660_c0_g5~~TRINITY_DN1660_c0_g5_i1.p1  ORF type:complete len:286 (-),score=79.42 TRINITY_DN1660_c0_g5_i1:321-1178(-)